MEWKRRVASTSWRNCNVRLPKKVSERESFGRVSQFHSHHYLCSSDEYLCSLLVASTHRAARHNACAPAPARLGLQPPFRRDESTPCAMDGRGGACAAAAARRGLSCRARRSRSLVRHFAQRRRAPLLAPSPAARAAAVVANASRSPDRGAASAFTAAARPARRAIAGAAMRSRKRLCQGEVRGWAHRGRRRLGVR